MRRARARRGRAFPAVALVLAVLLVWAAVSGLDRSLRAARADGAPGTFTASHVDCVQHPGHESCTCYGAFEPDAGGPANERIYLYGRDRDTCEIGRAAAAVDVGSANRVYGPEGSNEWVLTVGLAGVGLGLGAWAVLAWRAAGRPRKVD